MVPTVPLKDQMGRWHIRDILSFVFSIKGDEGILGSGASVERVA